MKQLIPFLFLISIASFGQNFDIQGHRGCRGLLPENSIEAMKNAVDLGVTTLELDVVISTDNQVLLSHEPFLSHEICLDTNGNEIYENNEKSYNLYKMNYNEIRKCDCGSKIHPRFLNQKKLKTFKPLLYEMIDSVENYIKKKYPNKTIFYNIETKSAIEGDTIFHPRPKEFVDLLLKVLENKKILDRVFIQSFDVRTLQYLHQIQGNVKTVLLVENNFSIKENLRLLGFNPNIYSPDFNLLTKKDIAFLHHKKIKIIPWTVNEISDMKKLILMHVDGLISDYPNRYFEMLSSTK
ncbi:glycerophosphodiester phosphodiesterase family protein [Flavobacterium sp.]|uniref:glycerophosphodiester phosphodiesterase family protein n=1 Tax=Flavobacterium sp. TaxID=239 RepID=UPI0038FBEB07